jgi:hypothetical protein
MTKLPVGIRTHDLLFWMHVQGDGCHPSLQGGGQENNIKIGKIEDQGVGEAQVVTDSPPPHPHTKKNSNFLAKKN